MTRIEHITEQLTEISLTSLMYYFWQLGWLIYPILFLTQYVVVITHLGQP